MSIIPKKLVALIWTVFCFSLTNAQDLQTTLWKKSLKITTGTTFINRLTILNVDSKIQRFQLVVDRNPAIRFLAEIPQTLTLSPGEALMIPLKGFVHRQPDSLVSTIRFQIRTQTGVVINDSFEVVLDERERPPLVLFSTDEPVMLYSGTETAQLPLRILHQRIRPEKIGIEVASMPEGIDRSEFPLALLLAPQLDTTLVISIHPQRVWSASIPYQITVTVRDSAGSVLRNVLFKVVVAATSKRFQSPEHNSREGYGVSGAVAKLSNHQWAREGRIWGRDSVGSAQVDFQLHYFDYPARNFQQLQNSHLSIRTNRALVRVGSLFDYHELPLLGRGVKLQFNRPDQQWTFWAVNSNPNWLNPDANTWAGHVYSARYEHAIPNRPGSGWAVSGNYFTNSATQRAGFLTFGSLQILASERHSLELLGSNSLEYARQNPDLARMTGWAGQLNYAYRSDRFNWVWRSYLSSPVYAGLQKGATLIQSQTTWHVSESTALIMRLNHIRYNQILFRSPIDRYRLQFGNRIAEASLTHRASRFTATLKPYWHAQSDEANPYVKQADSYRIASGISYFHGNRQRFEVSYDVGRFYPRGLSSAPTNRLSQRVFSSWTLGSFHLYGYWQKGPYFLSDLRAEQPLRIQMASVMPLVDVSLLNRRVVGSVGLNYLYDASFAGTRCLAVGRVRYDITPDLWVRAEGNATPYSQQSELAYSQYRLEVTKQFSRFSLNRRGQLRLQFFEDANANGRKDAGEPGIDSLLVTVNDNPLLTNSKGTIVYRNLPPGVYTVSAININRLGDPVLYREKITVASSVNRQIALPRTFRIRGQLRCQSAAYDRQPCQFSRFSLDVQRDQQSVMASVPTPDGGFAFHLAPGDYTLLVRDQARQPPSLVQSIPFKITSLGQYPAFNLAVDASTRSVEIKRFTAK